MNTELLTLAADARLAQLDLNAARRAHQAGQVTDRELSMTEAERDSALEFYEEAEALADEAAPLFAPRPWLADGAYVPDEVEQDWATEVLAPAKPRLRCAQCGSDHGRKGFSIGRMVGGDYVYDAVWGETRNLTEVPQGWTLSFAQDVEPNVIECDCWPNGVWSYLRK